MKLHINFQLQLCTLNITILRRILLSTVLDVLVSSVAWQCFAELLARSCKSTVVKTHFTALLASRFWDSIPWIWFTWIWVTNYKRLAAIHELLSLHCITRYKNLYELLLNLSVSKEICLFHSFLSFLISRPLSQPTKVSDFLVQPLCSSVCEVRPPIHLQPPFVPGESMPRYFSNFSSSVLLTSFHFFASANVFLPLLGFIVSSYFVTEYLLKNSTQKWLLNVVVVCIESLIV